MPAAAQLVYTNVEQERSPHRRRGFQLWLWSADLNDRPKVREEVEQRVNTFVRPDATSQFVRFIYAPLACEPLVMCARAVPLDEKDKFGRGGRFHTHALLIDRDEFLRAGADPFAVFDSGFAFQSDPDDPALDEAVRAKSLPAVELTLARRNTTAGDDRYRELVATLVAAALDPAVADTVAIPVPAADVELVVRQVTALLPPDARLRLSFDTLWTGKGRHVPRVAGAGTPALLQVWMFRRFVRFDPVRKGIHPPPRLSERAVKLAGWWVDHPELEDVDRRAGAAAVDWALTGPAHPLPDGLTAAAAEWVARQFSQAVADRWRAAKAELVADAVPPALADLPGVRERALAYLGEWGVDGVGRAVTGIPALDCVHWVSAAVFTRDHLDEPTARAVYSWRYQDRHTDSIKLRLAVCRWVPELLEYLCGELRSDAPTRDWLREYCRRTLPAEYRHPDAAVEATHRHLLAHASPPPEAEIAEALAARDGWPVEAVDRLRLLLRACGRLGGNPEQFLHGRPALFHWAADRLLPTTTAGMPFVTLELAESTREHYWGQFFRYDAKHPLALLGVRLAPPAGGLLRLFAGSLGLGFLARMDARFDSRTFPIEDEPVGVEKRNDWKAIEAARKQNKAGKLVAAVRQAGVEEFRKLANDHLLPHVTGWWVCGQLWDDGGLFAGVAVELSNPNDGGVAKPALFALAGSVVPVAAAGSEELPDFDTRRLNRFGWLLARLLDPAHTTRFGIPPSDDPSE